MTHSHEIHTVSALVKCITEYCDHEVPKSVPVFLCDLVC